MAAVASEPLRLTPVDQIIQGQNHICSYCTGALIDTRPLQDRQFCQSGIDDVLITQCGHTYGRECAHRMLRRLGRCTACHTDFLREEGDAEEEAREGGDGLRNALILFVMIFVLLILLRGVVYVFEGWYRHFISDQESEMGRMIEEPREAVDAVGEVLSLAYSWNLL